MFIIFINDIKSIIKFCDISFFADDGLIQIVCDVLSDGIVDLNKDLDEINKYLCSSKLSLNTSKTKFMIVTNRNVPKNVEIKINKSIIERVYEFKYLGIVLDHKLSLDPFTDDICRKLNKKFAIFKRCEKKLDFLSTLTYYNSLTQPHIDTCGSTFFMLNQSQISRIQLIQNRFMRTILRADSRTSIKLMLETLNWMSIKQRIIWNSLKMIHKILIGQAPAYLQSLFRTIGDSHNICTRRTDQLYIASTKLVSTDKSIFYDGLKIYNDAKISFERETELNLRQGFFSYLKTYAIKKYPMK